MYKTSIGPSKRKQHQLWGKTLLLLIVLSSITTLSIVAMRIDWQQVLPRGDIAGETAEMVDVTILNYYVAQRAFTSYQSDFSLEELASVRIGAFADDIGKVKHMVGSSTVEVIEQSEQESQIDQSYVLNDGLYQWMRNTSFDGVVIVPFERLDARLKTVRVDGQSIWDDDLSEYALVYEERVTVDKSTLHEVGVSNVDQDKIVTYVAGGEVIPARAVARKFRRTGDYTFPFHKVRDIFTQASISSILLENAVHGRPEPCYGCVWFVGDEDFLEGLDYLEVDVVSLAGNHMGDGGEAAVGRTIELLEEYDIAHTGASSINQEDASKPALLSVGDFTVAFLGYDDVAYYHWAGENHWGVARISERFDSGTKQILEDKIREDIDYAQQQADFVVVIMSWGDREYVNWPLEYQKELGHALIDAGADLIVGSHQHWVNALEFYQGKGIFYGIGNFVFDQTHTDPTRQGVFLKAFFYNRELAGFEIIPHQSCGPQQSSLDNEECNHFQPQILSEDDPVYREILDRMFEYTE